MSRNICQKIGEYNSGRNPERLAIKYKNMRQNSFVFLRGTCHLFYQDWPQSSPLNNAPATWICGDLHLENFGSYKGDNHLVYFDINDFDEGALAPCTWELARFLTSVLIGARTLGVNNPEAIALCCSYLDAYTNTLATGKPCWVETETSEGMVKDLLVSLKDRRHKDFLDRRAQIKKGKRQLIIDNQKTAIATPEQKHKVQAAIATWAAKQPNPEFFQILDIGQRIAGTSSIGLERYIAIVVGEGSPNQNYFLDIKESLPSALTSYITAAQPEWASEAERVVSIQKRMQAVSLAMLNPLVIDGKSYVLRRLQPSEDKINLAAWNGKLRRLQKVMKVMGGITAWDQLRGSGRQGAAIADELIAFAAAANSWQDAILSYAKSCAAQVEADYQEFAQGFDSNDSNLFPSQK